MAPIAHGRVLESCPSPLAKPAEVNATGMTSKDDVLRTVAQIISSELGLEEVDSTRTFFDLGADSLVIVRAHRRIEKSFEKKFQLVEMFRNPTVAALADWLVGNPTAREERGHEDRAVARRRYQERRRNAGGSK